MLAARFVPHCRGAHHVNVNNPPGGHQCAWPHVVAAALLCDLRFVVAVAAAAALDLLVALCSGRRVAKRVERLRQTLFPAPPQRRRTLELQGLQPFCHSSGHCSGMGSCLVHHKVDQRSHVAAAAAALLRQPAHRSNCFVDFGVGPLGTAFVGAAVCPRAYPTVVVHGALRRAGGGLLQQRDRTRDTARARSENAPDTVSDLRVSVHSGQRRADTGLSVGASGGQRLSEQVRERRRVAGFP